MFRYHDDVDDDESGIGSTNDDNMDEVEREDDDDEPLPRLMIGWRNAMAGLSETPFDINAKQQYPPLDKGQLEAICLELFVVSPICSGIVVKDREEEEDDDG